ncbi:hypothetical protein [Microtetraspora glauca]|uniref:Uncharacterized protein n=1 Tax=Microtetraspora glauca TaxID=1996 RepID=A0ABV3GTV0_MICGL
MVIEDPLQLLRRLRLGREEYCQRLLTMLILTGPYPRWNSRSIPSDKGVRFLRELDVLSFGAGAWHGQPVFVDEFDLPGRGDDEQGGAPDYAVLWEQRLWMIELKTETTSHRPGQVTGYFTLADHHYPAARIDLTYLTPPMPLARPTTGEQMRFAHLTWGQVTPLIVDVWGDGGEIERRVAEQLLAALDGIGNPWSRWRAERLGRQHPSINTAASEGTSASADAAVVTAAEPELIGIDPFDAAMALAEATGRDGRQRTLGHSATTLEELQRLRLSLRQAIRALPDGSLTRHVLPWLWNAATSGGRALTTSGAETGYELRLSRYRQPFC